MEENNVEQTHKIILLGDIAVGKTCVVLRACRNVFAEDQNPTIGAQFLQLRDESKNPPVTMAVYDTAGDERFRSTIPMYIRYTEAALIVFAKNDKKSLESVTYWKKMVDDYQPDAKIFLVENKSDITDGELVDQDEVQRIANNNNLEFFEVSAKTGDKINDLFRRVSDACCQNEIALADQPIPIDDKNEQKCGC